MQPTVTVVIVIVSPAEMAEMINDLLPSVL